jgi:hypothetical protein
MAIRDRISQGKVVAQQCLLGGFTDDHQKHEIEGRQLGQRTPPGNLEQYHQRQVNPGRA